MTADTEPEFSRPLDLEALGSGVHEAQIAAGAAERAALAARFGLLGLDRLEAKLRVHGAAKGRRVRIDGDFEAEVVQACVVSLEPVRSVLEQSFSQVYSLDPDAAAAGTLAVTPGPEADDPEPLGADGLDLGEAVAQELALALDPYPRAPDAADLPAPGEPGSETPEVPRPFDALRSLKPR